MSLIYKRGAYQPHFTQVINDYCGEIFSFAKRINKKYLILPLVILKSIEWSIYRWYKTPIHRFYGVKSNELIYMITSRCNEKCPKCGIWKKQESDAQHMQISHFMDCLNRLHHNLYQVTLTGGEPLLFKNDVILIAKEAKKLNVPMVLISNGVYLDRDFLELYATFEHILVISLESVEKNSWNKFRSLKNFEIVMKNIFLAKKILKDKFRIQSVCAKESIGDIEKVANFCKEHDILHNIQSYQDFGGNWAVAEDDSALDDNSPCVARKNICIYPNGDVVKCFDHHRIPYAKEPLGNIQQCDIIEILCNKRSTQISKIMKSCSLPCKNLSCNKPQSNLFV
jgi:MoaA/NifB/PqqE/SkfB family radical SAM enzyme